MLTFYKDTEESEFPHIAAGRERWLQPTQHAE